MFLKYEKREYTKGKPLTFLRVVEGYWENGKSKQRTIKSYGALEKQSDPKAYIKMIKDEIEEMTQKITITIPKSKNANDAIHNINYFYSLSFLNNLYSILDLDTYFNDYQRKLNIKIQYNLAEIIKYYSLMHIVKPDSKRRTISYLNYLYNNSYDFSEDDTYNSMDYLYEVFDDVQVYMRNKINEKLNLDTSRILYDCTNYYCEIDFNDTIDNLRHRGVSKEHRIDPIIGMGLFIDMNGVPLKMKVFNGNVAESVTLVDSIKELKDKYKLSKLVLVADKGINSNTNINRLIESGNGYVFSQILKGKKGNKFQDELFNEENYHIRFSVDGGIVYKSKTYIEDYTYINSKGEQKITKRKVLIYYDAKDHYIAKKKILEKVEISKRSIINGAYSIPKGFEEYVEYLIIDKTTGLEVSSAKVKKDLNTTQIEKNLKYAGYKSIPHTFV